MTPKEAIQLKQGYVSSRMLALKIGWAQSSILRILRENNWLRFKTVASQKWIELTSVREWLGPQSGHNLDDWSESQVPHRQIRSAQKGSTP